VSIPDDTFLAAVTEAIRVRSEVEGVPWWLATRWDTAAVLAGHPEDVGASPVDYPDMPEDVVMAKSRELIAKGLLDGCETDGCDCRGSYEIIPAERRTAM
jgi:hypothetical protein